MTVVQIGGYEIRTNRTGRHELALHDPDGEGLGRTLVLPARTVVFQGPPDSVSFMASILFESTAVLTVCVDHGDTRGDLFFGIDPTPHGHTPISAHRLTGWPAVWTPTAHAFVGVPAVERDYGDPVDRSRTGVDNITLDVEAWWVASVVVPRFRRYPVEFPQNPIVR